MVRLITSVTDAFERGWNAPIGRVVRSISLATVLLGGILLIELNRRGWLPGLPRSFPHIHLVSISWAVTLLLVYEIVEMLLALGRSVAESVGRHLQLYALILLRDAFAKLGSLPEPITISSNDFHTLAVMGADAAGAVVLFASATFFSRLQRHVPITHDVPGSELFVALKKLLALTLLVVLALLCVRDVYALAWGDATHRLFDTFFTVLVFVDVLLAVISLAFTEVPAVIFRNFGFALAAILLRLAIASPEFVRPGLGLGGALVAIAVTVAYNLALEHDKLTPGPDETPSSEPPMPEHEENEA